VPHPSTFFVEGWDTTNLNHRALNQGTASQAAEKHIVLEGHGFSRAA
jgi:hypothetical protein